MTAVVRAPTVTRSLVAGWFSFPEMGATAGDVIARDLVASWLREAGRDVELAVAPPFADGIDWRTADPARFQELVLVCGPCGNGPPLTELLNRFAGSRLVGVDLSMLQPLGEWNPFDVLIERDSDRASNPDVTLGAVLAPVPVVGLVLVHPQPEYGDRGRHREVNAMLDRLLAGRDVAVVQIDTRLDENATGLRSAAQVASLIARTDVVVTTRLHGAALALGHGVPPLVVDPVTGGAKVIAQARAVGWSAAHIVEEIDDAGLATSFDWCLSEEARNLAGQVSVSARERVGRLRGRFLGELDRRG